MSGQHERLGCASTAAAQILFLHRECPRGFVDYTAPGFNVTVLGQQLMEWSVRWAMNLTDVAGKLCDWTKFGAAPPNHTSDPQMKAVAQFEYAVALVLEMGHREHASETLLSSATMVKLIQAELAAHRPMKLLLNGSTMHYVVVDGYRMSGNTFLVHLNVGHSGFDDGWYDFDAPLCLRHHPDGSEAEDVSCAMLFDDVDFKQLWTIRPLNRAAIV